MFRHSAKTLLLLHMRRASSVAESVSEGAIAKPKRRKPPTSGFEGIPREVLSHYNNVVSLSVTSNRVSWSSIARENRNFELKALTTQTVDYKPKSSIIIVLNLAKEIVNKIPDGDIFIIEEPTTTAPKAHNTMYALLATQLRSYVLGQLSTRKNGSQVIMAAKTLALARSFDLSVGSEKVSGQNIASKIFTSRKWNFLNISDDIRSNYEAGNSIQKELLSNIFLTNIAYWKLTNQLSLDEEEEEKENNS